MARCLPPERHSGRKTIAVLVDYIDQILDGYESELRAGFEAQCRAHDVNLLIVVGRALQAQESVSAHYNDVYRLLMPSCVDGLIVLSSALARSVGPTAFVEWCKQLGPVPLCSLGAALPGIPSVVADSRAGMSAVVEHIVEKHQRKRVVLLHCAGNLDGVERLEVCTEALVRRGLPIDQRSIIDAHFDMSTAERALLALIDEGAKFDAVIAGNDGMAVGALRAAQARGLQVPADVLVSGFDDVSVSRLTDPALTTVRPPLRRMARLAVDAIVAQWNGAQVDECVAVPAELVVRGSCGCGQTQASVSKPDESAQSERLLAEALQLELQGKKGALLLSVEGLLSKSDPNDVDANPALAALSALRFASSQAWPPEVEASWYAAQRAISAFHARHQAKQRVHVESMYVLLLDEARHLLAQPDMASLKLRLQEVLPNIHQRDLAIGLLPAEMSGQCELLVDLKQGKNVPPPPGTVDVSQLFNDPRRRTQFVMPITTEQRMVGIMAIEAQDGFFNYQVLRDHISTAVRVVALHQETVHQTTLRERSVQERLATAERMRSLSVLAGGVAHDLNNALGSLVALSDVVLDELDQRRQNPQHDESELRADLVSIKQGALSAAETIKDLMTLGRRDQVQRAPIDVNQTIQACVRDLRMQLPQDRLRAVHLHIEAASKPLPILGSESHVSRAVGNLLRNAVEVAGQGGVVTLRAEAVSLAEPLLAYESIPAGEYVAVSVADTGSGIAPEQVKKIFEPFFSTKKLSNVSGSGLGLAIVHGVVKEHEGFVDVHSVVGQGSRFVLYFPRLDGFKDERDAPISVRQGRAKILVVDDDPIQQRVAQRVLGRLGYEVTTVASGVQAYRLVCEPSESTQGALESALSSAFDVLIMDMALNEAESGLEVFQRIRGKFPQQRGIIASGHSAASGDAASGPDLLWLAKPYTASSLARAVQSLLSLEKRFSTSPPA
ncbi:MAG: substrate-binding domain-containing protein [Polyangiaceae bacterium]